MKRRHASVLGWMGLCLSCSVYDQALLADRITGAAGAGAGGSGGNVSAGASGSGAVSAGSTAGEDTGGATLTAGSDPGPGAGNGGTGGIAQEPGGASGEGGATPEPLPTGQGTITFERWWDVPGSSMNDFPWDDVPDEVTTVDSMRAPQVQADNFAARLRGFITAPLDGNYRFWIACDDNCQLWLSTDELQDNDVLIAHLEGVDRWTEVDEWGKFAAQESALITLEAGKRYRVEAVVKQGIGGSNLSVGWLLPGQSGADTPVVIPGTQLSPFESP